MVEIVQQTHQSNHTILLGFVGHELLSHHNVEFVTVIFVHGTFDTELRHMKILLDWFSLYVWSANRSMFLYFVPNPLNVSIDIEHDRANHFQEAFYIRVGVIDKPTPRRKWIKMCIIEEL